MTSESLGPILVNLFIFHSANTRYFDIVIEDFVAATKCFLMATCTESSTPSMLFGPSTAIQSRSPPQNQQQQNSVTEIISNFEAFFNAFLCFLNVSSVQATPDAKRACTALNAVQESEGWAADIKDDGEVSLGIEVSIYLFNEGMFQT